MSFCAHRCQKFFLTRSCQPQYIFALLFCLSSRALVDVQLHPSTCTRTVLLILQLSEMIKTSCLWFSSVLLLSFLSLEIYMKKCCENTGPHRMGKFPLLIYNFTNTSSNLLFSMSCWTDSRLPKVIVSLDFTERINTVTTQKYRWRWTLQQRVLSTESCEHGKLPVKPLFLAWQVLCFRRVESAVEKWFDIKSGCFHYVN